MKQNVSAPVAAIILALVIVASIIVFSRPRAGGPGQEQFVLPYEPPADENELQTLHQGLAPLGIACVNPPLATDQRKGARVALVAPDGAAGRAGMQPGDLIVAFNGHNVSGPYALLPAVRWADRTKPAPVVVVRGGKEEKLVIGGRTSRPKPGTGASAVPPGT